MADFKMVVEDEEWLVELKKLFEGRMEKAEAVLLELGFEKVIIERLNFQLELDSFVNQVLDLLIDDLNAYDEKIVFEKVQEMLLSPRLDV